jgi:hypothetical protein
MQFEEAWPGRRVRTPAGEGGTVVSRANGTAYVAIGEGEFHRFAVGQLETHQHEGPPPTRGRPRATRSFPGHTA